jgi:hypothetical protein
LTGSRNLIGDIHDVLPGGGNPCPAVAVLHTDIEKANFLIDLEATGTARATAFYADVHILVTTSCVPQLLDTLPQPPQPTCQDISLDGVHCYDVCGACSCSQIHTLRGDLATWKTPDLNLLTLVGRSGVEDNFAYCVRGNQLSLKNDTTEFIFDRTFLIGSCKLADYGVLPGCDFASKSTVCAGTAQPCSEYSGYDCTEPGCTPVEVCEGRDWNCADYCTPGLGCTMMDGGCVGTASCSAINVQSICSGYGDCSWNPHCTGTPPPCSSYALDECSHHPGCSYPTKP